MLKTKIATKLVPADDQLVSRFSGVIVPMITPCTAAGEIDLVAVGRCAREQTARGCDGVFVISSTGGMPFLDEEDRAAIVQAARAACPRESMLYAGISGMGVKQTLRYAKQASDEGADAAVIMSPFFLRLSQDELLSYFTEIADGCPIPLCVYHHVAMPTPVDVETMAKLAEHPNVVALKDTSGQADRMRELVKATRHTGLVLLQGSEPIILETLQAGGHGCVSALAGIAPEWHRDLVDAFRADQPEQALIAQQRIHTLWKMFELPHMRRSFGYFARSLAVATKYRGWCVSANTVVPGFQFDEAFDDLIEKHLVDCGLPVAD